MLEIKILGSGCANCVKLGDLTKEAVQELGLEANVVKVTDMQDILSYGVMRTPGLVVNDEVKISGRVPKKEEIIQVLKSL